MKPKLKYLLVFFCILSALSTAGYILSMSVRGISVRLFMDDAFYYFQVAYNIAHGYGSTFDRLHPTNGYHPLWLIVLIPVYILVNDKSVALIVIMLLQFILFAIGVIVGISGILRNQPARLKPYGLDAALLTTFLLLTFTPLFTKMFLGGLESALYWAVLMLASNLHSRVLQNSKQVIGWCLLGIMFGIVFLSRIDSVVLVGSWLAFTIFKYRQEGTKNLRLTLGKIACVLIPVTLIMGLYFAWNFYHYGHVLTTSGMIKFHPTSDFRMFMGSVLLLVIWFSISWFGAHPRWFSVHPQVPFIAFPFLYFSALVILGPAEIVRIWYHIPTVLAMYFLMAIVFTYLFTWTQTVKANISILGWLWQGRRGILAIILACFLILFVGESMLSDWLDESRFVKWDRVQTATLYLAETTPLSAIVASFDGGRVGYTLPNRTINLDGLANSHDYRQVVEDRTLFSYLIRNQVRYVINHVNSGEASLLDRLRKLDPNAPWDRQTRVIYDDLFNDPREGKRRVQILEILPDR